MIHRNVKTLLTVIHRENNDVYNTRNATSDRDRTIIADSAIRGTCKIIRHINTTVNIHIICNTPSNRNQYITNNRYDYGVRAMLLACVLITTTTVRLNINMLSRNIGVDSSLMMNSRILIYVNSVRMIDSGSQRVTRDHTAYEHTCAINVDV